MADSFGTSLLVDDGDLVIQGGSLVEVHGLPNLIQGLTLRVFTPFGTDIFSPTYGFDLSAIFGGSIDRRSPIPRRTEYDDRRVFPPRPEGRRRSYGRRRLDLDS